MINGAGGSVSLQSLAAAMPYIVDSPDFHGAKHDGMTDDTAAIIAAINSAVAAGISNGSYYAEVWFSAARYAVKGALTQGGATLGNAQIPLPVIPSTGMKFTLVLKGIADGSAFAHWQQTVVQQNGAVLVTNLNTGFSATFGSASCLGGPTTQQLGATDGGFSNMLLVLDGLTMVTGANVACVGIDLQCLAQANIGTLGMSASVIPGSAVIPTNPLYGLRMPQASNNDNCPIRSFSAEGFFYALLPGEHTVLDRMTALYNDTAIYVVSTSGHGMYFNYVSCELGNHVLQAGTSGGGATMPIMTGLIDTEQMGNSGAFQDVIDNTGQLVGTINYADIGGRAFTTGGTINPHLHLVNVKTA